MSNHEIVDDKVAPPSFGGLWDDAYAATLSQPELLLYRSNLLGADKRITNFAGGNTSAKISMEHPHNGSTVDVLWVKGSGGDLGSMGLDGFASLEMPALLDLKKLYRGLEFEDEMVGKLAHCTFNLNPRAASIDTPLHAFIAHRHVDHMHPDAIIAIAAARDGEAITAKLFDGTVGWLGWQRPGFDLGLQLEAATNENPDLDGIILAGHGLFTWGSTAQNCYETTLRVIATADSWLREQCKEPVFGGRERNALPRGERRQVVARLLPELRGMIGSAQKKVAHFDDSDAVLEFVNSKDLALLAALGTSCPDHFLRTKIRPLVVEPDLFDGAVANGKLRELITSYQDSYKAYYQRNALVDSPAIRDPNPVVFLLPGVGMVTLAKDKPTARIAAEYYVNAINVMRGASSVSEYVGLSENEAFKIEYWALEEAKLQRQPKPKPLTGRVAFVTGAAGGIGRAITRRFLAEGACVAMFDIDAAGLSKVHEEFESVFGSDRILAIEGDVTVEDSVAQAMEDTVLAFGGVDNVVSNAGIASAAPIEDTSLEMWQKNFDILSTGYFLIAREAMRLLQRQKTGGSLIFVASKNALVASAQASAYSAAKASEVQLARVLAVEGAAVGIRVNVVNPDAVIEDSKIWSGEWRQERARAYKIDEKQLVEHYKQRSLLKCSVSPDDVAEAIYFFASDKSAKSTGNILNVDAGNAGAFTR